MKEELLDDWLWKNRKKLREIVYLNLLPSSECFWNGLEWKIECEIPYQKANEEQKKLWD